MNGRDRPPAPPIAPVAPGAPAAPAATAASDAPGAPGPGIAAAIAPTPAGAYEVCYHCGLPVTTPGRWQVRVDQVMRPMCCAGCEAVARTIVEAGLTDYYKHRKAPAQAAGDPARTLAELQRLGLYDDPDIQQQFSRTVDDGVECTLAIEGMRCGACVWLLERALRSEPGVLSASVNFASERATLRWQPGAVRLSSLLARIREIGYKALPFDAREHEAEVARASKALFRRMMIAGLGMMQVMMYAVPVYVAGPDGIDPEFELLMRWASLLLTLPVVLYSAAPFFAGAWRDLRVRRPGMDTPVALGIGAAFAASVVATLRRQGEVYFDSVTMFVFLLLLARWLEWVARRRASRAVDALALSVPEAIERLQADGTAQTVPAAKAAIGDRFRVATGERVPLDARLLEGTASVDQSLLTGESLPVVRHAGDEIAGGSIVTGHPVVLEVLRAPKDSVPSVVQRLIDRAAGEKPRIATLADRIAAWFVAGLLLLALGTWAVWMLHEPARALPIAIAVLVVSCPCALSLATPAALAAASGALLRQGLLITRGHALESLATITDVVFDKTGTLTLGRPQLVEVVGLAPQGLPGVVIGAAPAREQVLRIAVALEAGSTHPFAQALRDAWPEQAAAAQALEVLAGQGVRGTVDGVRYALGSAAFVGAPPTVPGSDPARHQGDSLVWLARLGDPDAGSPGAAPSAPSADAGVPDPAAHARPQSIACLVLRDALREDAPRVLGRLRAQGLAVHLLSGDREGAVRQAAAHLGIDDWRADARPADKLAYVSGLQARGRRVLMVGDGLNDAPVLAAADVSIAVSDATSLARVASDVVSVRPGLAQVERALTMARRTGAVIRQNLGWATVYNAVAIPAAAIGWVPPWVAALGMSLSSLMVALNALRLWSWNRSTS